MGGEGESRALLRDQEPLVKNTTKQIKDSFLLRAASSFLLSGARRQPLPPAPGTQASLLLLLLCSLQHCGLHKSDNTHTAAAMHSEDL